MNIFALLVAYVVAGLGFYAVNSTKSPLDQAPLWRNPINCILLWPVTLVITPWYGAFFGTLITAAVVYFIISFMASLF